MIREGLQERTPVLHPPVNPLDAGFQARLPPQAGHPFLAHTNAFIP